MNSNDPLLPPGLEVPDGRTIASRRAYMAAVFKFHGQYTDEMMAHETNQAVELNSVFLHQNPKFTKIGHLYFEYMIDNAVWHNWFIDQRNAGKPMPQWPWSEARPDHRDMSEGISPIYDQWLRDNAPTEPEPMLASVLPSASIAPGTVSRPAAETGRADGPAQDLGPPRFPTRPSPTIASDTFPPQPSSPVRSPVPSLAVRQHVWKAIYGDRWTDDPGCGPFEVSIPPWLDFEGLVYGRDGYLFASALEVIHQDLTISWGVNDPDSLTELEKLLPRDFDYRPNRLIVGFSYGVDYEDIDNQSRLRALWDNVKGWVDTVYGGKPRTLISHLRHAPETQLAEIIRQQEP